ncbi:MAG: RCC1 domain-containing protein [Polyangiaceae bacterium]
MKRYAGILLGALVAAGCGGADNGETGSTEEPLDLGTLIPSAYHGLSVGAAHACVVDACERLVCWGLNDFSQGTVPKSFRIERWKEVSAGARHTCGLTTQGVIKCWGDNTHGQASPPSGSGFKRIEAGALHSCAIDAIGTPRCWGQITTPPPSYLARSTTGIASGYGYACAEYDDASAQAKLLSCWSGGSVAPSPSFFVNPLGNDPPHGTTAGQFHACTLRGQQLLCWGDNHHGQADGRGIRGNNDPFGVLDLEDRAGTWLFPAYTTGRYGWTEVEAGRLHTCGINTGYANYIGRPTNVFCWGSDVSGETSGIPHKQFLELSLGDSVSCGVTDTHQVLCWGRRSNLPREPQLPTECVNYTLPPQPSF